MYPLTQYPSGWSVLEAVRHLAASWDQENTHEDFPAERLHALFEAGALRAFKAVTPGGSTDALLDVLRAIGGADLSLGRVYEGHVNAVQLIATYGDAEQRATLDTDLEAGRTFGVWNTEPTPGLAIRKVGDDRWLLDGAKSFATGAGHLDRILVTARDETGGKQLVLVPIAGQTARADNAGWQVRGMRGTCSGAFDFSDMAIGREGVIGAANDYEREPRFSAGAWRFTAVQLGAVEALVRHLRDHLVATGKSDDPIQRARFATCLTETRSAGLWVRRAAHLAETQAAEAIPFVLMTRGIVEEAGLRTMEAAARSVGTASFFAKSRIDRITRDLGLYLRQPVPDQARDRAAAAWLEEDCWGDDRWW
ncbi:acyl-CoA dehydrogenase family protein [Sphingomonas sp. PP-CE-1G-424]|uniref:acyl-CoA dehydrogenase family protein n=1 Tax=Sphingomonas sp. PP-CE-1G-424 TaxID=2135658 RepID=UPI001054BD60|nr:acyl-CoA dehydrogenase family protein [Sphingomonas sp. PP-CE-1G-424]TCP71919.1 alkylation response protein AidB-like acyl-CoA dehydrogenase [Sphingomonas sp. PP-CE-1G-424]